MCSMSISGDSPSDEILNLGAALAATVWIFHFFFFLKKWTSLIRLQLYRLKSSILFQDGQRSIRINPRKRLNDLVIDM